RGCHVVVNPTPGTSAIRVTQFRRLPTTTTARCRKQSRRGAYGSASNQVPTANCALCLQEETLERVVAMSFGRCMTNAQGGSINIMHHIILRIRIKAFSAE
ncbi:unnamed protein product, partial [Dicrocoelium dendriticum]